MNDRDEFQPLLDEVKAYFETEAGDRREALSRVERLLGSGPIDWNRCLETLSGVEPAKLREGDTLVVMILRRLSELGGGLSEQDRASRIRPIMKLYRGLEPSSGGRPWALVALAGGGGEAELEAFAELVAEAAPTDSDQTAAAFAVLFQKRRLFVDALFPRLLDALDQLTAAAPILDLANHITRREMVTRHPAADRSTQLASLLGNLAHRLGGLEEHTSAARGTKDTVGQIDESVGLAVALCDALGLIGDPETIGKLYQALELAHRRIRTEAAAALARLGEERGVEVVLEMTGEPVARLRALAYAEELGVLEQAPDENQTAYARAEAELALWLSQPMQFGIPPVSFELIDQRELYWPGYDELVECFLIRFSYRLGDREYSNVGLAGPASYAFGADLLSLAPDEIYSAFAGHDAEHEEIREFDYDQLDQGQRLEAARLEAKLRTSGYDAIKPAILGLFFGQRVLVAEVVKDGRPAVAVADNEEILSRSVDGSPRPLGPAELYCIYKGRKLLRAFNE